MTDHHGDIDSVSGKTTTGHEWDGIKELNTPLPRWWVITFYLTIVWAIGYWIVYPAWPLLWSNTTGILHYSPEIHLSWINCVSVVEPTLNADTRSIPAMNPPVKPEVLQIDDDRPLYVAQRKVYPQSISGTFRRIKWTLMVVCIGVYYLLPFVRWNRGLGAPDQALLIDLPNSRFYFFFIELWPQEVYYFTGLLIVAAMALFLMNAIGGRIWCGYLCPQTVWTDLFYAVERFVEGDRRERIRADAAGMNANRAAKRVLKHAIWLLIAWWTG